MNKCQNQLRFLFARSWPNTTLAKLEKNLILKTTTLIWALNFNSFFSLQGKLNQFLLKMKRMNDCKISGINDEFAEISYRKFTLIIHNETHFVNASDFCEKNNCDNWVELEIPELMFIEDHFNIYSGYYVSYNTIEKIADKITPSPVKYILWMLEKYTDHRMNYLLEKKLELQDRLIENLKILVAEPEN